MRRVTQKTSAASLAGVVGVYFGTCYGVERGADLGYAVFEGADVSALSYVVPGV